MARAPLAGGRFLVTGGAGFIGSHLVDALLDAGAADVVALDNLFLGEESRLAGAVARGAVFCRDDAEIATSLEYVVAGRGFDGVFNCATKPLNYSFVNPANACDTNVRVILNLLELQRRGAFGTLCHFSTSEVYGSARYEPMDEAHPFAPLTTYAAGKAAADLILGSYVAMFGLDAFIVRPFNNYGPRQNHRGPLAGVVPATVRRILDGEPPLVQGSGRQSRDFIFVLDTVAAVLALWAKTAPGEAVNVAAEEQVAIGDLVARIAGVMGYAGPVAREPARAADVAAHRGSSALLRSKVALALTPLEEGLRLTADYYRELRGAAAGTRW